jgi:F0F1-type ATP synthase membrane subunit b/b'
MDKTLHDLGGIVLTGLPTFVLVLILAACVKFLYLGPLEKVLAERDRLTEGARKTAEESLKNADDRISKYEAELSRARSEIYVEQAEFLRKIHQEQSEMVKAARDEAEKMVTAVKLSLAWEAGVARENLAAHSEMLAGEIVEAVLRPRTA